VGFLLKPTYALNSRALIAPCNLPSRRHPIPVLATVLQQLAGDNTPSAPSYLGRDVADFWTG